MIEIGIGRRRITARGHADSSDGCAAVSAILYALAGGLENVCSAPWHVEPGDADISIPEDNRDAQAMRMMADIGLRQLAQVRADIQISDIIGAGR